MTRIDCAIFDFDGTLTDVELHARPFHAASKEELARVLGCGVGSVERDWREIDEEHAAGSAELGWLVDGQIVGPARGDPYLISNAIVRAVLERHGVDNPGPLVFDVHRAAYLRTPPPFRTDAKEALDFAWQSGAKVAVVTNSSTETVAARLDELGLAWRNELGLVGHARKFVIGAPAHADGRFDALPHQIFVRGLSRPILLERGAYFDVLVSVWKGVGGPQSTLIVGDLYELDLAMPAALGCAVHLVTRPSTMVHERNAALAESRGSASDVLAGAVIQRLG